MPRTSHPAATAGPRPRPSPERIDLIARSHQRSVAHGLSRIARPDYTPLGRPDLAQVRERNRRLFSQAAPLMDMLFDQISGTESMVVLCDAAGVILHTVGDAEFLSRASQVALHPGVDWSEPAKGTNAIGTALVEAAPTLVHADEHFMVANQFLTCSAAPILDPRGHVLGALDVTGDHRSYHRHTMALVRMTARMIENHWLSDQHRRALRVHFHPRAECLGTLVEGLLAVTPDGRVLGCNRSALELLRVDGATLRRHGLSGLLGCSASQLIDRFRSPLATPLSVTTDAGSFYVQARHGAPAWGEVSDVADTGDTGEGGATGGPAPLTGIAARSAPGAALDGRAPTRADVRARSVDGASAADRAARAHALHAAGAGAQAPLLTLRACALARPMLDDAIRLAGGGSLFIDDLAALPVPLQAVLADALARPDGPRLLAGATAADSLLPALQRHFATADTGAAAGDPAAGGPSAVQAMATAGPRGRPPPPGVPGASDAPDVWATPSPAPTLGALQQRAIADAVAAAGGNISVAARRLGVSRNTVYRKLRAARP